MSKTKTPAKKASTKAMVKKGTKPAKQAAPAKVGQHSAIDAAAKVLGESKEPMNTREMIEVMAKKGYWTSPGGKTPWATLYSAILNEVTTKGKESRFKKTDRGHFALNK
jgi:HB1/ASXL restriction endonuclease-like protein with HTH domain